MEPIKAVVEKAMSGLNQQRESMQALNEKPECAFCGKNPPRMLSSLCETCAVCVTCGTKESPSYLRASVGLLCVECNDKAKAKAQEVKDKWEADARIAAAGFYKAHEKVSFDVLDSRQKSVATQYLAIPFGSLIINGTSGSGKTWTAVAVAKKLMERGSTAKYLSVPWMFAFIRDCTFHDKNFQITEYVQSLLNYDYIVLDDLGAHRATDWAIETLYLILDQWEANEKKGIICTTNLSMDEIAKAFSDRIASRLAASCKLIKLDGDDKRIR